MNQGCDGKALGSLEPFSLPYFFLLPPTFVVTISYHAFKREVACVLIICKDSQAGRGRGLAALAAVGFGEGQNPKGWGRGSF